MNDIKVLYCRLVKRLIRRSSAECCYILVNQCLKRYILVIFPAVSLFQNFMTICSLRVE